MKIHNIVRFDSDGRSGEKSRVILTFADRDKALERVGHLYDQFNPGKDVYGIGTPYPTFHVISKTLIGSKTLVRQIRKNKVTA